MFLEASLVEPLRVPLGFGPLPGCTTQGIVRLPWRAPPVMAGQGLSWCCQSVDDLRDTAWDEAAAPFILLEPEWKVWRHLPHATARRQWMRGRVAAKDAVRLLLLDRYSVIAPLEAIAILPDEQGQPQVTCTRLPRADALISVSISHCGNSSVALAAERTDRCCDVGIDVASQTDTHDGLAEGGFTSFEMELLVTYPEPERTHWLLCLWCAKESVGKALGVGLMGNPLNYIVRRMDPARGEVDIEPNFTSGVSPYNKTTITAHVGSDRGLAYAVVYLKGI